MATVQTAPEVNLPSSPLQSQEQQDLISLTMAALRLVNPWSVATQQTSNSWSHPIKQDQDPKNRIITLSEVSFHDTHQDCWVIIYDRVYDITSFLYEHPGGEDIMLEYAGRDASLAFRGSGHTRGATRALDRFLIGELPMHERLYRRTGGIRLSDIPE